MKKVVAVAGPTAVGKTKYSIEIAKAFNGEIVSCDSMQLYKYMDIGSAKPTEEEQRQVPHHLVDFLDPREEFSVAQYQGLAKAAIDDIFARDKLPVISGGTGLYLNSLLYDMDFSSAPEDDSYRRGLEGIALQKGSEELHRMLADKDFEAAAEIHPNNKKKIIRALERLNAGEGRIKHFKELNSETADYDVILIGLTRDRQELYERINKRVDILIEAGLMDEVRSLMDIGLTQDAISMKGIGYKEIMDYFLGNCTLEAVIDKVKKNTRHYAKKQLTWFRRYDKMKWYNISDFTGEDIALKEILTWLEKKT
ncbi:MAG: tRNA (adenosine(37)-N6)-dimethylallyltransferase MiaA [Clostridiales bacterium]|nr:tRNA (adenosine(37)-N6)-dimethylallyltransferase MiaA [Clostridiales bacterium]